MVESSLKIFRKKNQNNVILFLIIFVIVILNGNLFDPAELYKFGYTSKLIKAGEVVETLGWGSEAVHGDILVSPIQREPLYTFFLNLFSSDNYNYVIFLQWIALALAWFLWGRIILQKFGWVTTGFFLIFILLAPIPALFSSVLFPYAFNFLFLTAALVSLLRGMENKHWAWFLASGLGFGLAIYERSTYLLLPLFLLIVLILFRKKVSLPIRFPILMFVTSVVIILPWIVYMRTFGVLGMNQMTGFTLGFAYGSLSSPESTEYIDSFDFFVRQFGGDWGTQSFYREEFVKNQISYLDSEKTVTSLVLQKMKNNPAQVLKTIIINVAAFPTRLMSIETGRYLEFSVRGSPSVYRQNFARPVPPSFLDLVIFIFAFIGTFRLYKQHKPLALLVGILFVYILAFSTTIVLFDPRYRGPLDALIYLAAAYAIGSLLKSRSKKIGKSSFKKDVICWVCGNKNMFFIKNSDIDNLQVDQFSITDKNYGMTLALLKCENCNFVQAGDADSVLGQYENIKDSRYIETRAQRLLQADKILLDSGLAGYKGRLLDVGAGAGILVEAASKRGWLAEGVEPSVWLCRVANNRGHRVVQGVLPNMQIVGHFNAVTLIDVIEHVTDPHSLLQEIRGLLEKDGRLVLVTPDVGSFFARVLRFKWWHFRVAHIGYFNQQNLRLLLERAGFEILTTSRPTWYLPGDYIWERIALYLPRFMRIKPPTILKRVTLPINLRDSLLIVAKKAE